MTEGDWLACADPDVMLTFLHTRHGASARKGRLFVAACSRLVWLRLKEERDRTAVELNERLAEGLVPHHRLRALIHPRLWASANPAARANILRDLYGSPFRPSTLESAWLTPTVTDLATVAYRERALPSGELDPFRLTILADALEEAGCTDPVILTHLRGPGPHVRGCWALDLALGKR
jgi:hypothetical protein